MNPFSYRCKNRMLTDSEVRKLGEFEKARRIPWIASSSLSEEPNLTATAEKRKHIALVIMLVAALLPIPVIVFALIQKLRKIR